MPKKIAVLLLNLGGPDSIEAIRPFLFNLFSDREIIELPLQPLLARIIARSRSKKVAARYEAIGGKSPILKLTEDQAKALEKSLNEQYKGKVEIKTYVGMRYWHPFITETVTRIKREGFDRLIVLSLFPHYSRATTGSCFNELDRSLKNKGFSAVDKIDTWYDHPLYLDALAETISEGLSRFSKEGGAVKVLFSAHALPQSFVDQGDPYPEHLKATIDGIVERSGGLDWQLAYQSRSGPVKWMEPQTDATIVKLADEGVRRMLVVPISFVSDHIETLYEIDIMYQELALEKGMREFIRSPSLNSRPQFIAALTAIVGDRLDRHLES